MRVSYSGTDVLFEAKARMLSRAGMKTAEMHKWVEGHCGFITPVLIIVLLIWHLDL